MVEIKPYYFRIPRLGANLAVPFFHEPYLTQKIFDLALEAKMNISRNLKNSRARRNKKQILSNQRS